MTVTVKYSVRDLVGSMRDGAYDIPDGATIEELIVLSQKEAGETLSDDVKNSFIFLLNSRTAAWDTLLSDGDKLRVLYKILGG